MSMLPRIATISALLAPSIAAAADAQAKISGGEEVGPEEHPSAGFIMFIFDDLDYEEPRVFSGCSASLIAPDVVLTAAHCLHNQEIYEDAPDWYSYWRLFFTTSADMSGYDFDTHVALPEDAVRSSGRVMHPDYDFENECDGDGESDSLRQCNDLGLLFLEEPSPGPFGWLPSEDEAAGIVEGAPVVVVGYGLSHSDNPDSGGIRRQASTVIVEVGGHELRIGEPDPAAHKCLGDSGGPTFMDVETALAHSERIIGVTSGAYTREDGTNRTCTSGGRDTRVDTYLDWIDSEMRKACDDGLRTACEEPGILRPPEDFDTGEFFEEPEAKACGCSSRGTGSTPAAVLVLLLGSVLLRRTV